MPAAKPASADEAKRLQALHALAVLDTAPEPAFDRLAWLAAQLLATPMAAIGFVDAGREWFKARIGLDVAELPREQGFGAVAITADRVLVVEDAAVDPRFAGSPLVREHPCVRFCAGAPIVTADGVRLGSICCLDRAPRAITPEQEKGLQALAALVVDRLELRAALADGPDVPGDAAQDIAWPADAAAALDDSRCRLEALTAAGITGVVVGRGACILEANDEFLRMVGCTRERFARNGLRWDEITEPAWAEADRAAYEQLMATGRSSEFVKQYRRLDGGLVDVRISGVLLDRASERWLALISDITAHMADVRALRASEERFRLAARAVTGVVYDWDLASGKVLRSEGLFDLLGVRPEDAPADAGWWSERIDRADVERVTRLREAALFGTSSHYEIESGLRHVEGRLVQVIDRGWIVRDAEGRPIRVVGVLTDITARRAAEAALAMSEARFRLALAAAPVVVFSQDLDLRYTWMHGPRLGFTAETVLGRTDRELLPADQAAVLEELKRQVIETGRPTRAEVTLEVDGASEGPATYDLSIEPLRTDAGACIGIMAAAFDITDRKEAEARLRHLAEHDALTGLPNRRLFTERLDEALARARRQGHKVALFSLDLNGFKAVNDTLGHVAGDALLRTLGRRIKRQVRREDTVARLGGDEFAVIQQDVHDLGEVLAVATRLLERIKRPVRIGGQLVHPSASMGAALFPDDGTDPVELLRHADAALYRAKAQGRDLVQFFTPEMNAGLERRRLLEAELRAALAAGQLRLCYQPQIDLRHGGIVGMEALLRWQHPRLGAVPPGTFVPLAEQAGLAAELGRFVLLEACRQARAWLDAGLAAPRIGINLSPGEFGRTDLRRQVGDALAEAGLPGDRLELEVTEPMLQAKAELAQDLLARLRDLGVSIAVDDFGTGSSSLAHLHRLPLSRIKIDRSFVADLPGGRDAAAVTTAIVRLGHTLGLQVGAEGVETEAQARFLARIGCEEAQGFLYGPALEPAEATSRLAAALRHPKPVASLAPMT